MECWSRSPAINSAWGFDLGSLILVLLLALPALASSLGMGEPQPPAVTARRSTPAPSWAQVVRVQRLNRDLPVADRLDVMTRGWRGQPYVIGPLGEGAPPDDDPPVRFDAFDCLTFVEEALAQALGNDPGDSAWVRNALRYGVGAPLTYEARRHFMLAEWIPNAVASGLLHDVTGDLPGAVQFRKEVTAVTWARWGRRALFNLPDARLPIGVLAGSLWPLEAAREYSADLPVGSVVFVVRELRDAIPIAITHVGLVLDGGKPVLRHASRRGRAEVRDEPLARYLDGLTAYPGWPVAGVIVLQTRERIPRRLRPQEGPRLAETPAQP